MEKFQKYLIGKEFTWIKYCSGIRQLFDLEYKVTRVMHIWNMKIIILQLMVVHRAAIIITGYYMLLPYTTRECILI